MALDDDVRGWPEAERVRVIVPQSDLGVSDQELVELMHRLRQLHAH